MYVRQELQPVTTTCVERPQQIPLQISCAEQCTNTLTTDLIQCLQNVPAQSLVDLGRSFKLYFGPSYGTVPLLEPPWILARTTDINKKDVLIGSTSSEACVLLATISVEVGQGTESVRNAVNMIFDAYKIDRADEGGKLLSRYGRDGTNMSWVYDMVADMIYDCPVLSFAQYLASRGNHVRTYVFDHKATFSTFNTCIGALRFQELDFVFGTPIHNASLDGTAAEVILSRKMIEMWTGFAKTGSLPNIRQDPWPYFTVAEQQHVRITTGPLEIISDYKKHTCKAMSDVMEELNSWQTHQ
ncbi:acetylcholinesterase-like [Ornithodoros turicata]|uniref:acetylcholinesterase-like n=1 Tax=Ornithodoros turicata TaxID=34597 RepID=UPI00313937AD